MAEPASVSPGEIYQKVEDGKVLLVCGYEDDARFNQLHLEGGISYSEFEKKLPSLSKDQEIVFY
jgi:hypothetical protein